MIEELLRDRLYRFVNDLAKAWGMENFDVQHAVRAGLLVNDLSRGLTKEIIATVHEVILKEEDAA